MASMLHTKSSRYVGHSFGPVSAVIVDTGFLILHNAFSDSQ